MRKVLVCGCAVLYSEFMSAHRLENPEKRMLKLKLLLNDLPEHHLETIKRLARHLHLVAAHSSVNRMDARNLAIVFGPNLLRFPSPPPASAASPALPPASGSGGAHEAVSMLVTDNIDQCRVIETLIKHVCFCSTSLHFTSFGLTVYCLLRTALQSASGLRSVRTRRRWPPAKSFIYASISEFIEYFYCCTSGEDERIPP